MDWATYAQNSHNHFTEYNLSFVKKYERANIADRAELEEYLPNIIENIKQCEGKEKWEAVNQLTQALHEYLTTYRHQYERIIVTKARLEASKALRSQHAEGIALIDIGLAYRDIGDMEQAITCLEQSINLAKESKDYRTEGRALNHLGNIYATIVDDMPHATKLITMAITIAQTIKDKKGQQLGFESLGHAYSVKSDIRHAIEYFEKALSIAQTIKDRRGETTISGRLGILYRKLGYIEQATKLHERQLAIARQNGYQEEEVNALRNLGNIQNALSNCHQAVTLYEQSLAAAREIKDRPQEEATLVNLGIAYAELGNTSKAIECFKGGLDIAQEIGDKSEIAIVSFNLASLLAQEKQLPETISHAKRAEDMLKQIGNWSALQQTQALIATIQPPNLSGVLNNLNDYILPRSEMRVLAKLQASNIGSTIESEACEFINHHISQEIGNVGGRINFPMKIDMLVKHYQPELAAHILLHFPDKFIHDAVGLLRNLDVVWSKGSIVRAVETLVCVMSIIDEQEAKLILAGMTNNARELVRSTAERMRQEHAERMRQEHRQKGQKQVIISSPSEMILIKAGDFIMGTSPEQVELLASALRNWQRSWFEREMPQRKMWLNTYWIDKYPVTNAQYKEFINATGYSVPWRNAPLAKQYNWDPSRGAYPEGKGEHPVVLVDWHDTNAYAKWAGKRLPTEAEWEKAARGTDDRIWPWGNSWEPSLCNHGIGQSRGTTPVTAHEKGASPYGVVDMVGNVWEWCATDFAPYRLKSSRGNSSDSRLVKILRGGCFNDEYPEVYRCAVREAMPPNEWEVYRGFRCVKDV